MRYYKFPEEGDPADDGLTYVETDGGWTIRQITVRDSQYLASNVDYPESGIGLADQQIDYDAFEEVTPISSDEFEAVWNTHLAQHGHDWIASKARYPVGQRVHGSVRIFYPQGVIIKLDATTLGIVAYDAYREAIGTAIPSTGVAVAVTVDGYDERNHWIVLTQPTVHWEPKRM
jgi:hypothetical protein